MKNIRRRERRKRRFAAADAENVSASDRHHTMHAGRGD